ncbi:hypothetical protein [Haloarchaeobius sp. DFWS5]|uniref:hypothetical protein n=1 Tax=Haloarchaeobius sp. DFWS5 TaxID=3446114 RepID=UPI003EBABE9E
MWVFELPAESTSISEEPSELVDVCERLFEPIDGFLTPGVAEFSVRVYPQNYPVEDIVELKHDTSRVCRQAVAVERRIVALTNALESVEVNDTEHRFVGTITLPLPETKFILTGGEYWIGPGHERQCANRSGHEPSGPTSHPPVEIEVSFGKRPDAERARTDPKTIFRLWIRTETDLWFEDTKIGAKNRRNLAAWLDAIESEFDLVDADFFSELLNKSDLHDRPHLRSLAPPEFE